MGMQPTPTPSLIPTDPPTTQPTDSPVTPTGAPASDPTPGPTYIRICTDGTSQDQLTCLKARTKELEREVELLINETESLGDSVKVACEKYKRDIAAAITTCN